jgi:hypothetical protein
MKTDNPPATPMNPLHLLIQRATRAPIRDLARIAKVTVLAQLDASDNR